MHRDGVVEIGTSHLVLAIDLEATLQEILHSVLGGREKAVTVLLCPVQVNQVMQLLICCLQESEPLRSFEPLLGRAAGLPAA